MENNEYVIVSKITIQKRIEELFTEAKELLEEDRLEWQDEFLNYKDFSPNFEEYSDNSKYFYIIMGKIESLQDYLSQLTPLIPEIEKQKLQFAIEQIKSLSSMTNSDYFYSTKEGRKVEELEQKLKQL